MLYLISFIGENILQNVLIICNNLKVVALFKRIQNWANNIESENKLILENSYRTICQIF